MFSMSLKKEIIFELTSNPRTGKTDGGRVTLLTSSALVSGRLFAEDDAAEGNDVGKFFQSSIAAASKKFEEARDLGEQIHPIPNDGALTLADAKVRCLSTGTTVLMPYITLFFDQIAGITIGDIDALEQAQLR